MPSERSALVTGATGFVGSHLARRLLADGWRVHAVVRPDSSREALPQGEEQLVVHVHDGTTAGLTRIMETAHPEIVFHLASLFLSQHTPKDVAPLIESNIRFGAKLVEAATQAGVRRFINTGTSWQHYRNEPYNPVCLYAATKQAFEAILRYYVEAASLRVITLKLSDTYGPGDRRQKLFALLDRVRKSGEPLAMSPGEQLLDLVHVDDVTQAYAVAAERLASDAVKSEESYAVMTGAPVSLRQVVALYEEAAGAPLPIRWGERPYRPREVMTPWSSGRRLPGWTPKIALKDGIRRLVEQTPRA